MNMILRNMSEYAIPLPDGQIVAVGGYASVAESVTLSRFVSAWIDGGALRAEPDLPIPTPEPGSWRKNRKAEQREETESE